MIRRQNIRRFASICRKFAGKRILVIGDLMVDQFVWGDVDRISPEAPVPVVHVRSESMRLGGAANVAGNLRALGADAILAGVIGDDYYGETFFDLARQQGIDASVVQADPTRSTIMKTRIIAHSQQVVRLDREQTRPLSGAVRRRMMAQIRELAPGLDGVILSDYGKGVISKDLMAGFRRALAGRDIPITVDPQVKNTLLYRNLTIITPNHHEAGATLGRKLETEDDVLWAGDALLRKLRLQAVLITRGEKGMALFEDGGRVTQIPTVAREVFDVTGAGDTVVATLTLALASGAKMHHAAAISNFAAGAVVGEVGTATITTERLIEMIGSTR